VRWSDSKLVVETLYSKWPNDSALLDLKQASFQRALCLGKGSRRGRESWLSKPDFGLRCSVLELSGKNCVLASRAANARCYWHDRESSVTQFQTFFVSLIVSISRRDLCLIQSGWAGSSIEAAPDPPKLPIVIFRTRSTLSFLRKSAFWLDAVS